MVPRSSDTITTKASHASEKPRAGGVARPRLAAFLDMLRQGKVHREFVDPPAFDDHGAVVRGGSGIEQAVQQRIADPAVERNAPSDMPFQGFTAFEGQKGPDFIFSQFLDRLDDHVGRLRGGDGPVLRPEGTPGRETFDGPADVGLKHEHERDQNRRKPRAKQPRGQDHVEALRAKIEQRDTADSYHQRPRCALSQPDKAEIEQNGYNNDIKKIGDSHAFL